MNKEKAVIKAEMTSKGDNDYSIYMEIEGSEQGIMKLLVEVVKNLINAGASVTDIKNAFITGIDESEVGKV